MAINKTGLIKRKNPKKSSEQETDKISSPRPQRVKCPNKYKNTQVNINICSLSILNFSNFRGGMTRFGQILEKEKRLNKCWRGTPGLGSAKPSVIFSEQPFIWWYSIQWQCIPQATLFGTGHWFGQSQKKPWLGQSQKKTIFCFDNMMLLLHMVL